jgi:hypothetical protein
MATFLVKKPRSQPEGPWCFAFFVVANIAGHHRQIAVATSRYPNELIPASVGSVVVGACQRLVHIFSDSANRLAIEGELALAANLYNEEPSFSAKPAELPKLNRWAWSMSDPELHTKPWDRSLIEFPFISSCLLMGITNDPVIRMRYPESRTHPLGLIYRDDNFAFGAVVIDLSDLSHVRYGIVAFAVQLFIRLPEGTPWPSYSYYDGIGDDEPVLEESRPRRPLSAVEYMTKFGYQIKDEVKGLDGVNLIDDTALDGRIIQLFAI